MRKKRSGVWNFRAAEIPVILPSIAFKLRWRSSESPVYILVYSVQKSVDAFKEYPPFLVTTPFLWESHPPDLSAYPGVPVSFGGRQSLPIIMCLKRLTNMNISLNYIFLVNRSSHQRCSMKKSVLRNFIKFTGKHLCH